MSEKVIQAAILELEDIAGSGIEQGLNERFDTIFPPFDPTIHVPIDYDQISLDGDDIEYGLLLKDWEFEKRLGKKNFLDWIEDWSQDVFRHMVENEKGIEQYTPEPENGYKDSKRKEHTDPGSNDKTKTDQQSCPVARTQNKRNTSNEHGYEETPRKRRRSSCVADLSGGDEK